MLQETMPLFLIWKILQNKIKTHHFTLPNLSIYLKNILFITKILTNFANLFTSTDKKKEIKQILYNNLLLLVSFKNLINSKIQN